MIATNIAFIALAIAAIASMLIAFRVVHAHEISVRKKNKQFEKNVMNEMAQQALLMKSARSIHTKGELFSK